MVAGRHRLLQRDSKRNPAVLRERNVVSVHRLKGDRMFFQLVFVAAVRGTIGHHRVLDADAGSCQNSLASAHHIDAAVGSGPHSKGQHGWIEGRIHEEGHRGHIQRAVLFLCADQHQRVGRGDCCRLSNIDFFHGNLPFCTFFQDRLP